MVPLAFVCFLIYKEGRYSKNLGQASFFFLSVMRIIARSKSQLICAVFIGFGGDRLLDFDPAQNT